MTQAQAIATGELKDTPLGGLLYSIFSRQLSGSLVIAENPERRHCITFRRGAPIKARLVDPFDLVGEILIEAGNLEPAQVLEVLEYSHQLELLFGEAALMLGYIETDSLSQALTVQTARRVARVFEYTVGTYGFYQEDFLATFGGEDNPSVDPLAVIAAGVRSSYDLGRLIRLLQGLQGQMLTTPATQEIIERFRFSDEEATVAEAVASGQTLQNIIATSGQPQTTVYGVIHCLHMTCLLAYGQVAAQLPPPEPKQETGPIVPAGPPQASQPPAQPLTQPPPPAQSAPTQPPRPSAPPQPPRPSASPQPSRPSASPQPPPQRPSASSQPARSSSPASPEKQAPAKPEPSASPKPPKPVKISKVFDDGTEKSQRRIEAETLIAKGDDATYFELLGATREATSTEIQKAWASRAKQFHPDKATGDCADLRPQFEQLMARITVAKDALIDPETRRAYLNSLDLSLDGKFKGPTKSRSSSPEDEVIRQALVADEAFMKAKILLKRNQFDEVEKLAKVATKSDPENGDYMALLAWAESRQRPRKAKFDDLLIRLRDAVKLAPKSEDAHFYFAQLLYQTGKLRKALSEFEETMEINPDNIDAVRMVRILRKKREDAIKKRKEQKSGGLLASLFGDKKK